MFFFEKCDKMHFYFKIIGMYKMNKILKKNILEILNDEEYIASEYNYLIFDIKNNETKYEKYEVKDIELKYNKQLDTKEDILLFIKHELAQQNDKWKEDDNVLVIQQLINARFYEGEYRQLQLIYLTTYKELILSLETKHNNYFEKLLQFNQLESCYIVDTSINFDGFDIKNQFIKVKNNLSELFSYKLYDDNGSLNPSSSNPIFCFYPKDLSNNWFFTTIKLSKDITIFVTHENNQRFICMENFESFVYSNLQDAISFAHCHNQIEKLILNDKIKYVPLLDLFYKKHKERLKDKLSNQQLEKMLQCLKEKC